MSKILIISGIVLIVAGIVFYFQGKIPYLGSLPGDIVFKKGRTTFYFPLASGIIISILATIIVNLIMKFFR
ncbi:MAG TPA: DUF2905 domain-containing protein [Spirochaetota bacterium]|nr:DUF2905 domain-containing protein [Spirochaetota bacterium]HPI87851.1 DUF2905 domain-containing protein [Spirochaetota bacterium]HPR47417.1 DUF2905 domain-containing protein [Spirochaetota bacterium]